MTDALFILSLCGFLILGLYRNTLILNIRLKAIRDGGLQHPAKEYERSSYVLMVLDLRKWTYRQFYPLLAKEKQ